MTYKEIFNNAFSDIYKRFPLSDTDTICRNAEKYSHELHLSRNVFYSSSKFKENPKNNFANKPFIVAISAIAVFSAMIGIVVAVTTNGGQVITSPGYAQMQAEQEAAMALDTHTVSDEEREYNESCTDLNISCEVTDFGIDLQWYKFDGYDIIIRYDVTCRGNIPDDLKNLPRPSSNYVVINGEEQNCPSFETYDIIGRSGNTFKLYAKLSLVVAPADEISVAVDNRRLNENEAVYTFTASANIPHDLQPVDCYENILLTVEGVELHLENLTIKPTSVLFTFSESVGGDDYNSVTMSLYKTLRVIMSDGSTLVFDGGYTGGGNVFTAELTKDNAIVPNEVDAVYLCGEKIYSKNDMIAESMVETAIAEDIYFNRSGFGTFRLEELRLTKRSLEFSFSPAYPESQIGGNELVRAKDFSIQIFYHDGNMKDISDLPYSMGVSLSQSAEITTVTFDLSEYPTAPGYVGYIVINNAIVPLESVNDDHGNENKVYSRKGENVNDAPAPLPSAIDAQGIYPSTKEGGLVGTAIDHSIEPSDNWISIPEE